MGDCPIVVWHEWIGTKNGSFPGAIEQLAATTDVVQINKRRKGRHGATCTYLLGQVGEQPADLGGEVDDVGGLVLGEDGVGVGPDAEVTVLGGEVDPLLVVLLVRLDVHADGLANKAGAPGDHDDVLLAVGGGILSRLLGGWLGHGWLVVGFYSFSCLLVVSGK